MFKKLSGIAIFSLILTACNAAQQPEQSVIEGELPVEGVSDVEKEIKDDFYPFVMDESGLITGFEYPAGNITSVGDGFYTVSESDGGWFVRIGSLGMMEANDNKLYFATYGSTNETIDGNQNVVSRVYSYDENTDSPELFFEYSASGVVGEWEVPYLRLIGYDPDENQLILVMLPSVDWSPGPCYGDDWLYESDMYYSIDLDIIVGETMMVPYEVPKSQLDEAKANQKLCEEEL